MRLDEALPGAPVIYWPGGNVHRHGIISSVSKLKGLGSILNGLVFVRFPGEGDSFACDPALLTLERVVPPASLLDGLADYGNARIAHLRWIRDRLVQKHGENPAVDYMIRLDAVIDELELEGKR